jgi:MFS family permease
MTVDQPPLRWQIYAVLIVLAFGTMVGRTLSIGPEASGGNDRSRWATVRALVDNGTYVIGQRDENGMDSGIMEEPEWKTNDKVMNPETKLFYSSKPPLLTTLLAGEYWLIKDLTGWSITTHRNQVQRTILITVNCIPLAVMLVLIAWMADRFGVTDWGRIFVVAAASFATFLTTFAVVLNNHTVAACAVAAAVAAALRTGALGPPAATQGPWWSFALAGFFAGFAACMDLPATAFAVGLGALLMRRAPRQTLLAFVPAAALPVAGLFATNYAAMGRLTLAYSEFGGPWYNYANSFWLGPSGIDRASEYETKWDYALHTLVGHHGLSSLTPIFILSIVGIALALTRKTTKDAVAEGAPVAAQMELRTLALLTAVVSGVVIAFYLWKTSNYGGRTGGPRWFFWLTPLLLIAMLPPVDWMARSRTGRVVACFLLAVSAISAAYPAAKPWTTHPWFYEWIKYMGWVQY